MASSANKWCKKLMTKDKANKVKTFFGTEGRFGVRTLEVNRAREASFFIPYTPTKKLTSK